MAIMNFYTAYIDNTDSKNLTLSPAQNLQRIINKFNMKDYSQKQLDSLKTLNFCDGLFGISSYANHLKNMEIISEFINVNIKVFQNILQGYALEKNPEAEISSEEQQQILKTFTNVPNDINTKKIKVSIKMILSEIGIAILIPIVCIIIRINTDPDYEQYINDKFFSQAYHTDVADESQPDDISSSESETDITHTESDSESIAESVSKPESSVSEQKSSVPEQNSKSEPEPSAAESSTESKEDKLNKLYDKIVVILNKASAEVNSKYTFCYLEGSDNVFLVISHDDSEASRYCDFYEIFDYEPTYIGKLYNGHSYFYMYDDTMFLGMYWSHMGAYRYGPVSYDYDYNKIEHITESEGYVEAGEEFPECPGSEVNMYPSSDLSLLNYVFFGEDMTLPDVTIYSDKIQEYNGVVYYTPLFAGRGDSGFLNFDNVKSSYRALPITGKQDEYGRQIDIDSFIVIGNVVYFTDQEQGSDGYIRSSLYKMNLDGSGLYKLSDSVDVRFKYENGKIECVPMMSQNTDTGMLVYDIANDKVSMEGGTLDVSQANQLLSGESYIEFDGGIYYRAHEYATAGQSDYNIVYYRQDTSTGKNQIVGYANNPQG